MIVVLQIAHRQMKKVPTTEDKMKKTEPKASVKVSCLEIGRSDRKGKKNSEISLSVESVRKV